MMMNWRSAHGLDGIKGGAYGHSEEAELKHLSQMT